MPYLYETHMHTSEVSACAVSTAAEQIKAYKKRGYAGVIVTDHFVNGNSNCPQAAPWDEKMRYFASGFEAAKTAGGRLGVDVFFGWEFTIRGSDFLTYGLDPDFLISNPGLDKLCIDDYSALVRRNGGYIAQAHPYRDAWYIENKFPAGPSLLDGVEVYNSADPYEINEKARLFAAQHNLPMQAGSDSHSAAHKRCSGVILDSRAGSIYDIIDAIKGRKAELI